jgi:hypothetical protein
MGFARTQQSYEGWTIQVDTRDDSPLPYRVRSGALVPLPKSPAQ